MIAFVVIYLLVTISIGYYASTRVKNTKDFILAGRSLPLYISTAALFATWFGSETILGASSQMALEGFPAVIQEPFGAALCLFLLGVFFAKPLYRMNILTFGDFYRIQYGKKMEIISGICLVLSYLGWIAAQMVALGIILNSITGIDIVTGILLGSGIVIFYTYLGGMWSIALTDFMQTIMIILGLCLTLYEMNAKISISEVFNLTPIGFFNFLPEPGTTEYINYLSAWMVIGLGSIPQQDLFQRVMSAKSERVAIISSLLASFFYLSIAMIPLLLALYGRILLPDVLENNSQMIIPSLVKSFTSPIVQVLFFGAMLSAIMSTASGAILAPASILSENLLKYLTLNHSWGEKKLLRYSRFSVVFIAMVGLVIALGRQDIFVLVEESSALSLVSLFSPLVFGLFYKKSTEKAAILSLFFGMASWLFAIWFDTSIEPLFYGFVASLIPLSMEYVFFQVRGESTK
ncbi:sodium:solute symporter family protein [Leptospira sp. GIMC2001]|uniref:sodium:solute symporter family protein n=1 Tax=Leptospira sp. GIMC2001 TaxID=1513297 RepID=UPI0023497AB7|nr:sodium:solute symporter family protein [Leptospira sp. GIMC2001]WCL50950.1 sodium:solute symporter family protein [Leptospira sp. GIMC2001]